MPHSDILRLWKNIKFRVCWVFKVYVWITCCGVVWMWVSFFKVTLRCIFSQQDHLQTIDFKCSVGSKFYVLSESQYIGMRHSIRCGDISGLLFRDFSIFINRYISALRRTIRTSNTTICRTNRVIKNESWNTSEISINYEDIRSVFWLRITGTRFRDTRIFKYLTIFPRSNLRVIHEFDGNFSWYPLFAELIGKMCEKKWFRDHPHSDRFKKSRIFWSIELIK